MCGLHRGACGTCDTDVREGTRDHRDPVLGEEERAAGDRMMTCASRCRGTRPALDL
ncbi:2Fe-2S iron-sulfur cluster binding domain-containing protein [Streptomyces lasalocidi]